MVCELLVSGMQLSDGPWLSSRGSPCVCPWNLSPASVVASKSRLVPLSLTDIFQTTALILQGNGLVNQSFKIRESVYNQLAFQCRCQAVQEFFHLLVLCHVLVVGITR